jgi:ABC-2 type transport system permease protein
VPIPIVLVGVLATGTGMLLSALYVRFRDIKPIWDVFLQALFYATPILYPIQLVQEKSESLTHLMMASPLASLIQGTRHLLLGNDSPSAASAIGGAVWLLIPAAILVIVTVLGFVVFHRTAPYAAEEL